MDELATTEIELKQPVQFRKFGDAPTTRGLIFDNVLSAAQGIKPISNQRHTLQLTGVAYHGPEQYSKKDIKQAVVSGQSLTRKLRGTWQLLDNTTGEPVAEKTSTLANVPYYTDDGVFIQNGVAYSLAHQLRLSSGVFARQKANGELESHVNVAPGKGRSHRVFMDPESGVFKINVGQANMPLYPVLRAMGATDEQLRGAWGRDLASVNAGKNDSQVIRKLYDRIAKKRVQGADEATMSQSVAEAFNSMELDGNVTRRTLGTPSTHMDLPTLLATTSKLIALNKGEAEPDDRDHLAYQHVYGPEDLIAERLSNSQQAMRQLLWKASTKSNLNAIGPGFFDKMISSAIIGSGLGAPIEQINPLEVFDQQSRVTRMGDGGIASLDSVPEDSRMVQPSQFGFIDYLRTPESAKAGVDMRLARNAVKGSDNRLYTQVIDNKTGQTVLKSPQDMADSVLGFPDDETDDSPMIPALVNGKLRYVDRDKVDYRVPDMESAFSPLGNLIPLKSMVKGQRAVMAARMITQALPLTDGEAPLLQSGMPGQDDRSFEDEYGTHAGAIFADSPATVVSVDSDSVTLKLQDGSTKNVELFNNLPSNRKTFMHQTAVVQPGDTVAPGQLLARSNYTDANGTAGIGKNLRVAYLAYKGLNFEDANVISESAARKMSSEHAYQHELEWDPKHHRGLRAFVSVFPSTYKRDQLANFNDDGLIKPGTEVKFGDPLVLAVRERERTHGSIHRGRGPSFVDATITWNHHSPGVVTDAVNTERGAAVVVKASSPMVVGDKMCFDPETSLLTKTGWKLVEEITDSDEIATLNPLTDELEYQRPTRVWKYHHDGDMYYFNTKHVNMLVTMDHHLWVAKPGKPYQAVTARDFYAAKGEWQFKKDCKWRGEEVEWMEFGQPVRTYCARTTVLTRVRMDDWLEFLGYYLAEGWCASPGYVKIGQFAKSPHHKKIAALLSRLGLSYRYADDEGRFEIGNVWLYELLKPLGDSYTKRVPEWIQELCPRQLYILLSSYLDGDGHRGACWEYGSSSESLAEDIQVICLKLGWSVTLKKNERDDNWQKRPHWRGRINRSHLRPWWKKRHAKVYKTNEERIVTYSGDVFCVTVPNHVVYCKRDGKTHWSHNSGRVGDKGVVAAIVPDDEMPTDLRGKPYEVLVNPLGIISRVNPAQIIEAALGKVAEKTGKPYKLQDFDTKRDMIEFAFNELKKHNMSDLESVVDPDTGRKINDIFTGNRWFMKLHHTSESKAQGRGLGAYTMDGAPAKGGDDGAKRVGMLNLGAILSHGAGKVAREFKMIRGQANPEYWSQFMSGFKPGTPEVPEVYHKFIAQLQSAGINPVREGTRTHLMALTDKDIMERAGDRVIENTETVSWDGTMKPKKGGLFDETLTGGHAGMRWSRLALHEPMPNPVMEEPIRRVLGVTEKKFRDILAGREELKGFSGPQAIVRALQNIDVTKEIEQSRQQAASARGGKRDDAVRRLGLLKSAHRMGIHPQDWMVNSIPVIPPKFRPVATMGVKKLPLVADANYLLKEAFDANRMLKEMSGQVDDVGDERLALYDSFKAVTGLGDPIHPKNVERGVKGALKQIFGSSPKYGTIQRKLLSTTTDLVGRATVVPDPELDMDSVGLPEEKAWDIYSPFIIRNLVRRGMSRFDAADAVEQKKDVARDAMMSEMKSRPVMVDRAPVLHRYGVMAFWPRVTKDNTMHLSPLVVGGFNADFDGDAMQFHVPGDDDSAQEMAEKMLPSKNLLSASKFKAHYLPSQEYVGGLYAASSRIDKQRQERVFRTLADAISAMYAGEINFDTRVAIHEH